MNDFDLGLAGRGFTLFEVWENEGRDFLYVTSDMQGIRGLQPGDVVVSRTWAPAGEPVIVNYAERKG